MRAFTRVFLLLLAVVAARADFVTDINCFSQTYGCGNEVAVSITVGGVNATCLCANGTRLVLEGIYSANRTFEGVNTTFRAGERMGGGVVAASPRLRLLQQLPLLRLNLHRWWHRRHCQLSR
ncbi:hypothetical protein ABPG75_004424 [Micractinium tetrahymenae]